MAGVSGDTTERTRRKELAEEKLARLRALAEDYRLLVFQAASLRERRDGLALELVDDGLTWRQVAEAAGFENPYLAALKRKREVVVPVEKQPR